MLLLPPRESCFLVWTCLWQVCEVSTPGSLHVKVAAALGTTQYSFDLKDLGAERGSSKQLLVPWYNTVQAAPVH